MNIRCDSISPEQLDDFYLSMGVPFGFDNSPELLEYARNAMEIDRLQAAFDDDQIVGTFGAFSLNVSVPGGASVPAAGTTVVTVMPTHRRQGIMRTLMQEHLEDAHRRNEPLAVLWASESSIYGRFGYGPACEQAVMRLEKPYARLIDPPKTVGAMRLVDTETALEAFPAIYSQVCPDRPGMFERTHAWWKNRILSDPEFKRNGATSLRHVLHQRDGANVGYVMYRTHTDTSSRKNELKIIELLGIDSEAERSLWQHIFGFDLIDTIKYWNQPLDDPIRWWIEQPRRMERKIEDSMWVRPVDVAAALSARRYSAAGSLVFRLNDEVCPWNDGVYRLDVDADGVGTCRPTDDEARMELTPFVLGTAYLGSVSFSDLARGGLVSASDDFVTSADQMFAWDRAPWCQEVF